MAVTQTLRVRELRQRDKRLHHHAELPLRQRRGQRRRAVVVKSGVRVGAHDTEDIEVKLIIDPSKLPAWTLNGGSQGGNGAALNGPEYDGYLTLTSGSEKLSVPWHVLPRKAADTQTELVQRGNPGPC